MMREHCVVALRVVNLIAIAMTVSTSQTRNLSTSLIAVYILNSVVERLYP